MRDRLHCITARACHNVAPSSVPSPQHLRRRTWILGIASGVGACLVALALQRHKRVIRSHGCDVTQSPGRLHKHNQVHHGTSITTHNQDRRCSDTRGGWILDCGWPSGPSSSTIPLLYCESLRYSAARLPRFVNHHHPRLVSTARSQLMQVSIPRHCAALHHGF